MRLKNRLNDLDLNQIQADSFLGNMAIPCYKEKINPIEFLFQVGRICNIAEYLNVPVMQLRDFIEEKTRK